MVASTVSHASAAIPALVRTAIIPAIYYCQYLDLCLAALVSDSTVLPRTLVKCDHLIKAVTRWSTFYSTKTNPSIKEFYLRAIAYSLKSPGPGFYYSLVCSGRPNLKCSLVCTTYCKLGSTSTCCMGSFIAPGPVVSAVWDPLWKCKFIYLKAYVRSGDSSDIAALPAEIQSTDQLHSRNTFSHPLSILLFDGILPTRNFISCAQAREPRGFSSSTLRSRHTAAQHIKYVTLQRRDYKSPVSRRDNKNWRSCRDRRKIFLCVFRNRIRNFMTAPDDFDTLSPTKIAKDDAHLVHNRLNNIELRMKRERHDISEALKVLNETAKDLYYLRRDWYRWSYVTDLNYVLNECSVSSVSVPQSLCLCFCDTTPAASQQSGKCACILVSVAATAAAVVAPPMYALLLYFSLFPSFPCPRLAMETFESPLCTSYRERGEVWYNARIVPVYTHSRARIRESVSYVDCCRGATAAAAAAAAAAAVAIAARLFAFFYPKFTLLCLWFVPSWCALELGPLRRARYSETSLPKEFNYYCLIKFCNGSYSVTQCRQQYLSKYVQKKPLSAETLHSLLGAVTRHGINAACTTPTSSSRHRYLELGLGSATTSARTRWTIRGQCIKARRVIYALHFHASTRPAAPTVHGAPTHRRRRLRLRGRRRLRRRRRRRQAPLVDFSLCVVRCARAVERVKLESAAAANGGVVGPLRAKAQQFQSSARLAVVPISCKPAFFSYSSYFCLALYSRQRGSSGLYEPRKKKAGGGKNARKERRSKGRRRRRKSRFIVRGGGSSSAQLASERANASAVTEAKVLGHVTMIYSYNTCAPCTRVSAPYAAAQPVHIRVGTHTRPHEHTRRRRRLYNKNRQSVDSRDTGRARPPTRIYTCSMYLAVRAMSRESACGGGYMQRRMIANLRTYMRSCRLDNSIVNFERPSVPPSISPKLLINRLSRAERKGRAAAGGVARASTTHTHVYTQVYSMYTEIVGQQQYSALVVLQFPDSNSRETIGRYKSGLTKSSHARCCAYTYAPRLAWRAAPGWRAIACAGPAAAAVAMAAEK
ncbi:unnamed protein product, partial [Trichogramma brassicae]